MGAEETSDRSASIDTGGGAYIAGSVSTGGGVFVGRDQIVGYTAGQVSALLEQLGKQFQPKPFNGRSPYVGLEAFQEDDASRFFGREQLIEELAGRLGSSRFVMVAGPSGSGKSSLVRAGLIPHLKQGRLPASERWFYAILRPGRDPLGALGQALAALVGHSNVVKEFQEQGIKDPHLLSQWSEIALGELPQRRLLLFIDQFEELFTQLSEKDESVRLAFLAQLEQAFSVETGRIIILLAMRSDFIGQCATYPGLNTLLNQQFMQVGEMSPDELVSAIARPALEVGLSIDPDLVAQVLADMRDQPGALPLMQFALTDLFQSAQAKGGVINLTLADYMARGGLRLALQRHADAAFEKLDDAEKLLARNVFKGLVQPGLGAVDTARTARFDELTPQGADPQAITALIRELADARLVTTEESGRDQPTVRLAHERLLEAWPWLRRLVDENRVAISLQNEIQQDALRWERNQKDDSYLYTGARLETARERLEEKRINLSVLGAEFVQAGIRRKLTIEEAEKAEQRQKLEEARRNANRNRKWAIGLGVVVVIAVIASLLAYSGQRSASFQRSTAVYNAQVANANAATATHALGLSEQRGTEVAQQKETAEREARQARASQLTTQARAVFDKDLKSALALVAEAVNIHIKAGEPPLPAALETLRAGLREPASRRLENMWFSPLSPIFSPDGRWLVSYGLAESACKICLADLNDPSSGLIALDGLSNYETALLFFSQDSRWLASPGEDGSLYVWDTNKPEEKPAILINNQVAFQIPAFSPDGSRIASADGDQVRIWDLQDLDAEPIVLQAPGQLQNLLAFGQDGRTLAVVQADNSILYWDLDEQRFKTLVSEDLSFSSGLDSYFGFSEDGRWLVASNGSIAVVWDAQDFAATPQILGNQSDGYSVVKDSTRAYLINHFGGEPGWAVWDLKNPFLDPGFYGGDNPPEPRSTSLDGQWRVSSDPTGEVWLQNLEYAEYEPLTEPLFLRGHSNIVSVLKFSPDSRWLVSGSDDNILRVWNLKNLSLDPIYLREENRIPFGKLFFSPNGRWFTVGEATAESGIVVLWDLQAEKPFSNARTLFGHNDLAMPLGFSADSRRLVSVSLDKTAKIWDLDNLDKDPTTLTLGDFPLQPGAPSESYPPPPSESLPSGNQLTGSPLDTFSLEQIEFAITRDFQWLARSGEEGELYLWEVQKPTAEPAVLHGQEGQVIRLEFSPDGWWLASSSNDNSLFLWNLQNLAEKPVILSGSIIGAPKMSFSPGGDWLAYESHDNVASEESKESSIRLVNLHDPTSDPLRLPLEPKTPLYSLVFSPSGRWLAANFDSQIHLWDIQNSQERVIHNTGNLYYLLFSPDERWLVRFGRVDELSLKDAIWAWDLNIPEPEASVLNKETGQIISLAFSPDGRYLAGNDTEGNVFFWHMRPEELLELACLTLRGDRQSAACEQSTP